MVRNSLTSNYNQQGEIVDSNACYSRTYDGTIEDVESVIAEVKLLKLLSRMTVQGTSGNATLTEYFCIDDQRILHALQRRENSNLDVRACC
jgi:hypothetical protein